MYSLIKYKNGGNIVCLTKRIKTTSRGSTILKPNGRFLVDRLHSHGVKYLHLQEQVTKNKQALLDNSDEELLKELQQWNENKIIVNIDSPENISAESESGESEEIRDLQVQDSGEAPNENSNERLPSVLPQLEYQTYLLLKLVSLKQIVKKENVMPLMVESETNKNRVANYHNAFAKIREYGDEQYNKRKNPENIIVVRKNYAKDKIEEGDYILCGACKGYYSNKNFRNHRNKDGRCNRLDHEKGINLVGIARVSSLKIPYVASDILKERIFPHFTKKHQKDVIFYDAVLIAFGNALCTKYFQSSSSSQNYKHISSSLRLLADILIEAKKLDPNIGEFDDLLYSKRRNLVMDAIRQRSKYGEDGGFKAPPTALECCNLLAKVATLMQSAALDEETRELSQRCGDFEINMRKQQNIHITRAARENQMAFQRQKLEVLPSTSEIKTLLDVLRQEFKSFYNSLSEDETVENYTGLAKALVAYIMVFNRKRPADVHNWQLHEFQEEEKLTEEDFITVPEQDRAILQGLRRYKTRHKLNKNEAILIDEDGRKAIKLLLASRKNFISDPKKNYIFAHPKGKRSPIIRADLALRDICLKHHLDISRLKSTKLRKHLATCTASLPRDTQKHLSAFMSHKEAVHFDVYQNRRATDVTVVGRILYHASGVNPEGLNVTTEINTSNQSVDELPATATWLIKMIVWIMIRTPFLSKKMRNIFHLK
ncbi:hypothetical protein JTB14_017063 [Gonioctena quinquepunctata]|nr:hypothetical protein JTB14_017063 [Gonioctena quinquepunctata]